MYDTTSRVPDRRLPIISPSDVSPLRPAGTIDGRLKGQVSHDQLRLYQLIYARFLASQMAPAVFTVTDVAVAAGPGVFKAQGKVLKFDGHRRVWPPGVKAAMDVLSKQPQCDMGKLAAIGYCMGGSMALDMARAGLPIRAVAAFHAAADKNRTTKVQVVA